MKPRIKKVSGIWYCKLISENFWASGIGYTPKDAYDDWILMELERS